MEYRQLGRSGLKVPELCFGAGTFGAANEFFKAWSETTQEEANRIVDICLDAGMNLFDTADIYSDGEQREGPGQGAGKAQSRESADLDQGDLPSRQGAERCWLVALPPDPVGRAIAEAARNRLHRHLPSACLRRDLAGRRDAARARRSGHARARSATSPARTSPDGT